LKFLVQKIKEYKERVNKPRVPWTGVQVGRRDRGGKGEGHGKKRNDHNKCGVNKKNN